MRRPATLLLPLLLALAASAPRHAAAWTAFVNGTVPGYDYAGSTAIDAFGNVYLGGRMTTQTGEDATVVKLAGDVEAWRYTAPGGNSSGVTAVRIDPGGDPVLAATAYGDGTNADWVVTKLAADTGTAIWRTVIDGGAAAADYPTALAVAPSGDVVVAGRFGELGGGYELAVVQLDGATGEKLWRYALPAVGGLDGALGVAIGAGGDVLVAGAYGDQFTVMRLDAASGTPAWSKAVAAGRANAVVFDPSSNAVDVAGDFADVNGSLFAVARLAFVDGSPLWTYAASGDDPARGDSAVAVAVARDGTGDVFAVGTVANVATDDDLFAVRLDASGAGDEGFVTLDVGAASYEWVSGLVVDADDHPILTGGTSQGGESDGYMLKLAADAGSAVWKRTFQGAAGGDDALGEVLLDGSEDAVAAASFFDGLGGHRFAAVRAAGTDGTETWRFTTHGDGFASNDAGYAVARDAGGDVVVAGTTQNAASGAAGSYDFTVAKLDGRRGVELWRYTGGAGGVYGVATDAARNVVAVGDAPATPSGDAGTVAKLGPGGDVLWVRQFVGAAGSGLLEGVALGPDGSVHVAGRLNDPDTQGDAFVAKLASDGTEAWRRLVVEKSADVVHAIAVASNGDVIVGGETDQTGVRWLVMRLAGADGAIVWSKTLTGSYPAISSTVGGLALDPATGDVVVAGLMGNTGTGPDFTVVRLAAADGAELWRLTDDGPSSGSDGAQAVTVDGAGEIVAAGFVRAGSRDAAYVVKAGPDETRRWSRTIDVPFLGDAHATAVAFDPAGGVVVAGYVPGTRQRSDVALVGLDGATGAETWRRVVDGDARASSDVARALVVDAAGGATAVGTIQRLASYADMGVVRLGPGGADAACVPLAAGDPGCRPCSAGCDDGDSCTTDACHTDGFCLWTPVAADAALSCVADRTLAPAACAGQRVPRPIVKTYRRATASVRRALRSSAATKADRLLRRASTLLGRVLVLVDRAEHRRRRPLGAACAEALRGFVADTRARVDAARAG